jgi:hypothetical protein
MKPRIPDSELYKLALAARLFPRNQPKEEHMPIWLDVSHMKGRTSAEEKSPTTNWKGKDLAAWQRIREALDKAMDDRDFSVIEQFVEAWTKTGGTSRVIQVTINDPRRGEPIKGNAIGYPSHNPRKRNAADVIDAIQQIQYREGRAPLRREIMEWLGEHRNGMDDAELSKVLKDLDLRDRVGE